MHPLIAGKLTRSLGLVAAIIVICQVATAAGAGPANAADREPAFVGGPVRFVPLGDSVVQEKGGNAFFGVLEVVPVGGSLALVNEVGFEDYLKGIAEVPGDWPEESLKAQAIAARTYALWTLEGGRVGEAKTVGYDICASTACQVYRGKDNTAGPRGAAWVRAVDATSSRAITYEGRPILARYHSTSGGRTRNNEDVYTNDGPRPYLKAVDSPDESDAPLFRWRTTFGFDRMSEMIRASSELTLRGELVDLRVVRHPDGSGRPDEVVIVGSGGESTVRAGTFSRVISREAKKHWPGEYPPPNPARPGSRLPDAIPSSHYVFVIDGDQIVVEGSGWGHGVGMSQYGAKGMAENGAKAEQILTHYYQGVRVERVREPETVRVGIGSGAGEIPITASGEFRVETSSGRVLADRVVGTFLVKSARGGVRVEFPAGIDAPLVVTAARVEPASLEPGGSAEIGFAVSKSAQVRSEIRDSGGRAVYASSPAIFPAGAATQPWSARDESGHDLKPGRYVLVVTAVSSGDRSELESTFEVLSPPGQGGSFMPTVLLVFLASVVGIAAVVVLRRRRPGGVGSREPTSSANQG